MCTSGCPTQNHKTWGECMRAKNLRIAYCQSVAGKDYTSQKKWDKDLAAYRDVRKEGIQPEGTTRTHVEMAKAISDRDGVAYGTWES